METSYGRSFFRRSIHVPYFVFKERKKSFAVDEFVHDHHLRLVPMGSWLGNRSSAFCNGKRSVDLIILIEISDYLSGNRGVSDCVD